MKRHQWFQRNNPNDVGIDVNPDRNSSKAKFCQSGYFRCNFGLVLDPRYARNDFERAHIESYKRCDGKWDCADGSDEAWIDDECKSLERNNTKCKLTIEEGLKFCGMINNFLYLEFPNKFTFL